MKMYALFAVLTAFCLNVKAGSAETRFSPYNVIIKSFQVNSDGKSNHIMVELERMEHSVTGYLERSTDGVQFSTIRTFILEEGFSGTLSYADRDVKAGTYYYRIQVAKSNYVPFYSNIISVKIVAPETTAKPVRMSNPFNNTIVVNGDFKEAGRLQVELSDMSGKVRLVKMIDIASNTKSINIPASKLHKGMYIISIKELGANDAKQLVTQCIYKNVE